ncbi:calcium ATPase transmembrane domain M-containing protein [Zopfochytrium polystomum]|nr:calcium ATPase transmembrane domain M-containing protein [Zopfochytrium polystomum]
MSTNNASNQFLLAPGARADTAEDLIAPVQEQAAADHAPSPLTTSAAAPATLAAGPGSQFDAGIPIRYRTLSLNIDQRARATKKGAAADSTANGAAAADGGLRIGDIKHHLNRVEDVCTRFSTHPSLGLDAAAVSRKAADGKNKISPPPTKYLQKALGYVFGGFNFLMWIAFIVTVLSYQPLGGSNPQIFNIGVAGLLFFVILISSVFYAFVDWSASRVMKSIANVTTASATVVRDGQVIDIPATDVVTGDVVQLSLGQRVPADLRIVSCTPDALFDRSILTGESKPVLASVDPTDENPLETLNLAFSSTFLVQGAATGVVFAIGDNTVIGQLVASSGKVRTEATTIQKELNLFTIIISTLSLSFFCISIITYEAWVKNAYPNYETISGAIVNAIGCLTAFVPQGLPVCVALSLSIIARRMSQRNVLVKNLATVETLGCMSVLCSDKTGTLTQGKMRVTAVAAVDRSLERLENADGVIAARDTAPRLVEELCVVARLCNGARFELDKEPGVPVSERKVKGDPTDTAILRFVEELGGVAAATAAAAHKRMFEIPFNSKNKWMATVVSDPAGTPLLLVKGAPDFLLSRCTTVMTAAGEYVPLDDAQRAAVTAVQERWAASGQRVIAVCSRPLAGMQKDFSLSAVDVGQLDRLVQAEMQALRLVSLVGIRDPPRAEVPEAIRVIRRAGVRVFMVTGDFIATAAAIARQVGIVSADRLDGIVDVKRLSKEAEANDGDGGALRAAFAKPENVKPSLEEQKHAPRALALSGAELVDLTDFEWDIVLGRYTEIVFARTSPDQKLKIVTELKKRGDNTVAVTGDGVNDAPALKAADIGVAMGAGSDVAKEAAAMVLMTNDFSSIIVAIENGRLVFDNLKKVILYLMPAGTYTEFMAVLSNVFFGMQLPLNSYLQVFFSVFNDVVMSVALMFELAEADLMTRAPRNARRDRLTDWRFFAQIYLFIGLMFWISAMGSWFLFFSNFGIHFHDLLGAWNAWGYYGGAYNYVLQGSTGFSLGDLNATAGIDVTTLGLPANYSIPANINTIPADFVPVLQNPDNGIMGALPGFAGLAGLVAAGNCVYYVCMVFLQFGGVLATRNRVVSILTSNPLWGPRRNLFIPLGMTFTFGFALMNVFTPGIQTVFATAPIPTQFWFIPIGLGLGVLLMDELRKLVARSFPGSVVAKAAW